MPIAPPTIVAKFLHYSDGAVPADEAAAFASALMASRAATSLSSGRVYSEKIRVSDFALR